MPFRDEPDHPLGRGPYGRDPVPENDPSMMDVLGAAWRQENTLDAAVDYLWRRPEYQDEPLHRPFDVIKGTRYEYDHSDRFVGSRSEQETRDIMGRIDREERDRETIAAGGVGGFIAAAAAGMADPTILLPGAVVLRGARGASLVRSAIASAGAVGGGTVAQEAILQGTHETRPLSDSVISVSAATILGGILGGAAAHLTRTEIDELAARMLADEAPAPAWTFGPPAPAEPAIADEVSPTPGVIPSGGGGVPASAGAAATPRAGGLTPASAGRIEVDVAGRKVRVDVGEAMSGLSPVTRLQHNTFEEARAAVRQMSDAGTSYEENVQAVPTLQRDASGRVVVDDAGNPVPGPVELRSVPTAEGGTVETRVKLWEAPLAEAVTELDLQYAQYFHGKAEPSWFEKARAPLESEAMRLFGAGGGKLTYKEFKEEVAKAQLRGDQHLIPEVAAAAAYGRKRLIEPLFERAKEVGTIHDEAADITVPERVEIPPDASPDLRAVYEAINARADESERLAKARTERPQRATSESYRHRVYDNQKIDRERPRFLGALVQHFEGGQKSAAIESEKHLRNADGLETDVFRLLGEYDQFVERQREALQRQRERVRRSELALAKKEGQHDTAIDVFREARRRAEQIRPDELDPEIDRGQVTRDLRAVKSGGYKPKALELAEFVRSRGGIRPGVLDALGRIDRPDLRASDMRAADMHRRGLVRRNGLDSDTMHQAAVEAGYLPEGGVPDDLVRALGDSLAGRSVYSHYDMVEIEKRDAIADIVTEIERQGLDASAWSPEEFTAFLSGNLQNFRPPTLANITASREAERQFGRLAKRRENIGAARRRAAEWHAELQRGLQALEDARPEVRAKAETLNKAIRGLRSEITAQRLRAKEHGDFAALSQAELYDIAQQVTNRIQGEVVRSPDLSMVPGPRGPMRARTLRIEDLKIERWLETDIERIWRRQQRYMAADIALAEKFDGDPAMRSVFDRLLDEFNRRTASATSDTERRKLKADYDAARRDLEALRDRVRGVYGLPADPSALSYRAAKTAMNLNYVRLLGGMTLSAVTDPGRIIMRYGLLGAFRDGFLPFAMSLSTARLAAREVRLAGTGLDMVLDTRALSIADLWDDFQRHTKFERAVEGLSSRFGLLTLMAPWNAAMKQMTGVATMSEILRAARAVSEGRASERQLRALSPTMSTAMARRVWEEFQAAGGVQKNGVYLPNTEAWKDLGVVEAFRAAIVREVDNVIITPGLERPLWMSQTWGKMLGQFKSFAFASNQRIIIAGLQQRDAAALSGLMSMVALGALSWQAKAWARGEDTSGYGPARWATEAIDNSGVLGIFGEVNAITEKISHGRLGLSAISGEQLSRYRSRSPVGSLLGPSYDLVESLARVPGAISVGQATRSDVRSVRQVFPLQNLFYLRGAIDQVQHGVNDALGIPRKREPLAD